MNRIVQGLWIGPELSVMEQLSIASFLRNGHEYHLYVYGEVKNIPMGTRVKEGDEILPVSMIFQYRREKSYSAFSNFFRYRLLLERGGWWVDTDTICLKPFGFEEEYVFSSEKLDSADFITSGVIGVPVASEVMRYTWQTCQAKNPQELVWGEVGPRLMAEAVRRFSLERYAKPYQVFCPVGYRDWHQVLDPDIVWQFDEAIHAIHLWNEMWRRNQQDKNHRYHPDCLYEQLKRKYLG